MAGIEKGSFAEIANKAKRLIDMDKNGTLNEIAKGSRGKIAEMSVDEIPNIDTTVMNESAEFPTRKGNDLSVDVPSSSNVSFSNSKLPKEILESFKNKSIGDETVSVLDDILPNVKNTNVNKQTRPTTITEIREHKEPQLTPNIDYSLIKTIVEDCMRKYASSITKKILSESKDTQENNSSQVKLMRIGEKFTILDDDGNLYEATLKFKKKIK